MARPTKYTPDRVGRLLQAIRAGNTRRAACAYAGIDENTLARWIARYGDFGESLTAAERIGEGVRAAAARKRATPAPVQFLLPIEHERVERKRLRQARVNRSRLMDRVGVEQLLATARTCGICDWRFGTQDPPMRRPVIDHDHDTGAARGVLCGRCNVAMGCLDDDPLLLAKAQVYLQSARADVAADDSEQLA